MEAEWPEAWYQWEGLGRIWKEELPKVHTDGVRWGRAGGGAREDLGWGNRVGVTH